MLFEIKNNLNINLKYNNVNNEVYHNDILIDTPNKNIGQVYDLKPRVYVSLGFACNMACSYCLQTHLKEKKTTVEQLDKIVDELNSIDLSNKNLGFWGGETLLYMDDIKYITSRLNQKTDISILTNGLLLGKHIDWLMENDIMIKVSHDGLSQKKNRGKCSITNDPETFKKLENYDKFVILSVLSGDTLDSDKQLKYYEGLLGFNNFQYGGSGLPYSVGDLNKYGFNVETLNEIVYRDFKYGRGNRYFPYYSKIRNFKKTILNQCHIDDITTKCGIDDEDTYRILSLQGRKLVCHEHVNDYTYNVLNDSDKMDVCGKCPVVHLCKGNCPIMSKTDKNFIEECPYRVEYFKAIMRLTFEDLFNNEIEVLDFIPISK